MRLWITVIALLLAAGAAYADVDVSVDLELGGSDWRYYYSPYWYWQDDDLRMYYGPSYRSYGTEYGLSVTAGDADNEGAAFELHDGGEVVGDESAEGFEGLAQKLRHLAL